MHNSSNDVHRASLTEKSTDAFLIPDGRCSQRCVHRRAKVSRTIAAGISAAMPVARAGVPVAAIERIPWGAAAGAPEDDEGNADESDCPDNE